MSTKLFSLFAAVAMSATLAACGGGGDSAPAPTPIAQVPPPPPAASAPAPAPTPSAPVRTAIYDAGLQRALADNGVPVAADGTIDTAVAQVKTELLIEQDYGIVDLTGLSAFTHLTKLYVYYNASLTNVADVSSLTNLDELGIYKGAFTSIDVSKMQYLETLGVTSVVGLDTVDTSKLAQLSELDVQNDCDDPSSPWGVTQGIKSLDLSHNANLQYLNADCNLLSSLDVSGNARLARASISRNRAILSLDFSANHQLTEIMVYGNSALTTMNLRGISGLPHRLAAWSTPNLATITVDTPSLYTTWMASAFHTVETQADGTIDTEYSVNANMAAGNVQMWLTNGTTFSN